VSATVPRRREHARRAAAPPPPWRRPSGRDFDALYDWYTEPHPDPFFVEIAGPTPSFDLAGLRAYCTDQGRLWIRHGTGATPLDGALLLTYIQSSMCVANLDWRFRSPPDPGTVASVALGAAIAALCASAGVRKAQLLALAGDTARIALAESLGLKREGVLAEHFYHAAAYHDLVLFGWMPEEPQPAPTHG
jgi:hypothetical protein